MFEHVFIAAVRTVFPEARPHGDVDVQLVAFGVGRIRIYQGAWSWADLARLPDVLGTTELRFSLRGAEVEYGDAVGGYLDIEVRWP